MGKLAIKRNNMAFKRKGIHTTNPLVADQAEITIPSSKTDQLGQGHTRAHYRTDGDLCPVRLLAEWFYNGTSRVASVPIRSSGADVQVDFHASCLYGNLVRTFLGKVTGSVEAISAKLISNTKLPSTQLGPAV